MRTELKLIWKGQETLDCKLSTLARHVRTRQECVRQMLYMMEGGSGRTLIPRGNMVRIHNSDLYADH